jgi:hypothetical protein
MNNTLWGDKTVDAITKLNTNRVLQQISDKIKDTITNSKFNMDECRSIASLKESILSNLLFILRDNKAPIEFQSEIGFDLHFDLDSQQISITFKNVFTYALYNHLDVVDPTATEYRDKAGTRYQVDERGHVLVMPVVPLEYISCKIEIERIQKCEA